MGFDAELEVKYDLVFGSGLWEQIVDAVYDLVGWNHPDTTHQEYESLTAFNNKITAFKDIIKKNNLVNKLKNPSKISIMNWVPIQSTATRIAAMIICVTVIVLDQYV